jgi:hypothetical protein
MKIYYLTPSHVDRNILEVYLSVMIPDLTVLRLDLFAPLGVRVAVMMFPQWTSGGDADLPFVRRIILFG